MTWRRFLVLLRGLSPNSATVVKMSARHTIGKKRDVVEVTTPADAQSTFERLFKRAKPK